MKPAHLKRTYLTWYGTVDRIYYEHLTHLSDWDKGYLTALMEVGVSLRPTEAQKRFLEYLGARFLEELPL